MLQDRCRPHDVQVGIVLAGEGGRRQVLDRRARSDGVGSMLIESDKRAGDRRRYIVGERDPFESPADLGAERADRLTVVWAQARQLIDTFDRGASSMIRRKASVVTQKPGGTWMPAIRESSPKCAPLPPTRATWVWSISSKPST